MDDLSKRLRGANPHAGQPLPAHALMTLDDLLAGRRVPERDRANLPPRHYRRPLLVLVPSLATLGVILALMTLAVVRPAPAAAVTPDRLPLAPTSWTVETLSEELMAPALTPSPSHSRRGAEWEGWFVQLEQDSPSAAFIQPQRTEFEWNEDDSGASRSIAGPPMSPDGTPIEPIPEAAARPGSVLYEDHWAPGELVTPFPVAPPDDVEGMRAYLKAFLKTQGGTRVDAPSAGDYLLALTSLLQVWTLGDSAQRAAIEVVLSAGDVTVAGETTDRAARPGVVLNTEPTELQPDYRTRLIIAPESWRILAVETNTVHGLPDFGIAAGAVTDYSIWR